MRCPHCTSAAAIAYKLAVESDMVKVEVTETSEFPDLPMKYNVIRGPKIIMNEIVEFVGAFKEDSFAGHILLGAFQPS